MPDAADTKRGAAKAPSTRRKAAPKGAAVEVTAADPPVVRLEIYAAQTPAPKAKRRTRKTPVRATAAPAKAEAPDLEGREAELVGSRSTRSGR